MKVVQRKVCLLGDFAVGKTSLVRRFVEDRFDDKYLSTIGVKVSRKTLQRVDNTLNLMIWDLVGGNEFSRREIGYLVGATGALVVCDLTRLDTLDAVSQYSHQLRTVNPQSVLVFVGNKVDLTEQRVITDEQLQALSDSWNGSYLLTSAKTGEQVEFAFSQLAQKIEEILP
ncbi:MAG: GTP-binding protein [Anaerolineales bacterium]|nr:GTP-binding protein [Anaerolineales bacterium]MCB8968015.1 GTP-binding protein [Ardenticatenaceae bacterium]